MPSRRIEAALDFRGPYRQWFPKKKHIKVGVVRRDRYQSMPSFPNIHIAVCIGAVGDVVHSEPLVALDITRPLAQNKVVGFELRL